MRFNHSTDRHGWGESFPWAGHLDKPDPLAAIGGPSRLWQLLLESLPEHTVLYVPPTAYVHPGDWPRLAGEGRSCLSSLFF